MKNNIIKGLLLLGASISLFASCTTSDYIEVDTNIITLAQDEIKTITITTNDGKAWSIDKTTTDEWLKFDSQTSKTIVLSADKNEDELLRSTTFFVNSGTASIKITVYQNQHSDGIARYRYLPQFVRSVISPNAKYAGGFITSFDDEGAWVFTPIIIDMETDEMHEVGKYPSSLFVLQDAAAITDDGQLFLTDGDHGGCIRFSLEEAGNYEIIESPVGFTSLPDIASSGDNGNIWVGYSTKAVPGKDNQYFPIKWTNGVSEELPRPELSYRDVPFVTGVMARGCSMDGSVIYGTTWDNWDTGLVYWKDGDVDYVWRENRREDYTDNGAGGQTPIILYDGLVGWGASPYQASASGKYISATFRTEKMAANHQSIDVKYCPAFFNTETKELIKFPEIDGSGMCATDSGIGFIATPTQMSSSGLVVDLASKAILGTIQAWILEKYGISIPNGYPNYISPDGSILFGTKLVSADSAPNWYVAPPINK